MSDESAVLSLAWIRVRHEPAAQWAFAHARAAEIDAHWRALVAERPQLYDGPVLLMRDARIGGNGLEATSFVTNFRNFLAWRDFGFPDESVVNLFAMAALRSADGAWMMGRMGPHTSNAGQIYFPAGTPDLDDLKDGEVDLDGSVYRELEEETGIAKADVRPQPGWRVVIDGRRIACLKILQCPPAAEALSARAAAFLAREARPELDGLVAVRGVADLDAATMPPFIQTFVRGLAAQPG